MAKHYVIAGNRANILANHFSKSGERHVPKHYNKIIDLVNDIHENKGVSTPDLDSIFILDYGFSDVNDINKMAEEMIDLQEILNIYQVNKIKIYLLTFTADLFNYIRTNIDSNILYKYCHIIYNSSPDIHLKRLEQIIDGKVDNASSVLTHPDRFSTVTETARIEERGKELIAENEVFHNKKRSKVHGYADREVREEDDFSSRHFDNSPQTEVDSSTDKKDEDTQSKINLNFVDKTFTKKPKSNLETQKSTASETPNINRSINNVKPLNNYPVDNPKHIIQAKDYLDIPTSKLIQDEGVITFLGLSGVGNSGLLANFAEVYAMAEKKVLILDLDVYRRGLLVYFDNYDEVTSNGYGDSDSLLIATNSDSISKHAVPVTDRIDILSISRSSTIRFQEIDTIINFLSNIIKKSREEYDVVLIDCPLEYLGQYLRPINLNSDKNIITITNKIHEIENTFVNYFSMYYESGASEQISNILRNSSVIVNKFQRGLRDSKGYELNLLRIKQLVDQAGNPFDQMLYLGEIPYYSDWENIIPRNIRYVMKDFLSTDDLFDYSPNLDLYKNILAKVLI